MGASEQHCLSNYPWSWLPSTCISQQSGEEKVWKMRNFHLVPSSPRSRWLTLTSQYDADAIYLSPPDITTVHPAAGARGPPRHYHSLQTHPSLPEEPHSSTTHLCTHAVHRLLPQQNIAWSGKGVLGSKLCVCVEKLTKTFWGVLGKRRWCGSSKSCSIQL